MPAFFMQDDVFRLKGSRILDQFPRFSLHFWPTGGSRHACPLSLNIPPYFTNFHREGGIFPQQKKITHCQVGFKRILKKSISQSHVCFSRQHASVTVKFKRRQALKISHLTIKDQQVFYATSALFFASCLFFGASGDSVYTYKLVRVPCKFGSLNHVRDLDFHSFVCIMLHHHLMEQCECVTLFSIKEFMWLTQDVMHHF